MHTMRLSGPIDEETGVEEVFYIHYNMGLDGEVLISKTLENEEGSPVDREGNLIPIGQGRYDDMRVPANVLLDFIGHVYVAGRINDIVERSTGKELIDLVIGV